MARSRLVTIPKREPIKIGHYTLHEKGLDVDGDPTYDEHERVGDFISRAHEASGWWLADWLRYGETRRDWKERLEAAEGASRLTRKTLMNVRSIGAIEPSRRRDDLEFGMHEPVAGLEPNEQSRWLERAAEEGWDRNELRREIRAAGRRAVIEGQSVLKGRHRVLMVDCPWKYREAQPSTSSSAAHYPPMSIEELCDLPVRKHTTKDAVMGFWVPAPLLYDDPGPQTVIKAWGFTYKALRIWSKVEGAGGWYTAGDIELFLICVKGVGTPDVPSGLPSCIHVERKSRVHSEKPEEFRRFLMKHWNIGPYLELFGRKPYPGWSVFGNDARLWEQGGGIDDAEEVEDQ